MKLRAAFASSFAVVLLAALPAAHAGDKKVKFSLRNDTGTQLELKVGDKVETLKPGDVLPVKLPIGTRITTNTATEHHQVGDVITVVSDSQPSNSTRSIGK
jgi:TusA-related sulfurtransferase